MYTFNSGYGQAVLAMLSSRVPALGRVFVVLDPDDTDEDNFNMLQQILKPDPNGQVRIYHTNASDGTTPFEQAYEDAESNNNDVILVDGNSTHALSEGLAWTKNRIHVFGMDGAGRVTQQGAKLQTPATADEAFVLKVTGVRNSFRNLKVIQASTNAAALNVIQFAGEGNLYENVSAIFGVVDNLDLTTAAEALMGEDAGTFRNCSFGTDVLLTSAARPVMLLDAVSGGNADGAKSNQFFDCEFRIMSSSATAHLIRLADTAGAKFLNEWINPRFNVVLNNTNSAIALTNAIASASGFNEGSLIFHNPSAANVTNLCAGVTSNVVVRGPAVSAQAGEGVTPS